MQRPGFEPGNPLRDKLLKLAPLTAWLPLHKLFHNFYLIILTISIKMQKIYIRRFLRREMTEVIELSEDNFEKNIAKGKWVVDFWAEWCGPCKILSPAVEAAAKEMKGKVHFGKVNVDAEGELAQRFEVMSIPTLIFFNDGKLLDRTSGAMDEDELKNIIEKVF